MKGPKMYNIIRFVCPRCNEPMRENARYCKKCGLEIDWRLPIEIVEVSDEW